LALPELKVTLISDLIFGAQASDVERTGSSVVDALLADGTFTPRAVTRNTTSDAALKLKARGVEIAQVDLNDTDTAALDRTIAGSEGIYAVCAYPGCHIT
jgi:hypothetical protein